jgi:hypothetical protein
MTLTNKVCTKNTLAWPSMDGAAVNMITKCCVNVGSIPERDNFISWF